MPYVATNCQIQSTMIIAQVKDWETLAPIEGAHVYVKQNPSNGSITDDIGSFALNVQPGQTVVVSHISYGTQEFAQNDINGEILLIPQDTALNEVDLGTVGKKPNLFKWAAWAAALFLVVKVSQGDKPKGLGKPKTLNVEL